LPDSDDLELDIGQSAHIIEEPNKFQSCEGRKRG
jgi:hypothetical protein